MAPISQKLSFASNGNTLSGGRKRSHISRASSSHGVLSSPPKYVAYSQVSSSLNSSVRHFYAMVIASSLK